MRIQSLTARLAAASLLIAAAAVTTTAVAQPGKTYKDPNTGQDCVQEDGDERSSDGRYVIYKYRNICGLTFVIWWQGPSGKKSSTGISPYSRSSLTIADEESHGSWWFD